MSHLDDGQVIKRSGTGLNVIFQRKFVQKKPEKPKEAEKPRVKPKEAEKPREKPKAPEKPPKEPKEYKTSDGKKKEEKKKEEKKEDYHSIIELERPTSTLTIYQIPPHVRVCAPFAYTPTLVSIGPFHRYLPGLRSMEDYKTSFLMRYYKNPPFEVLDRLVEGSFVSMKNLARNRSTIYILIPRHHL